MTVRQKLLLALAPLGAALVLLGAISVATISWLGRSSDTILADNYRSVLAMQRLLNAIERLDSAAAILLLDAPEGSAASAAAHRKVFEAELATGTGNVTEPGERDAIDRLNLQWQTYRTAFDALVAASPERRRVLYFRGLHPAFVNVRQSIEEVLTINQDAMVRKSDEARRGAARMNRLMIASSVGAFALGLVLSLGLLSRVLRRLQTLTRAVQRVGEQDFAARVEVTGNDELAQLATSFNAMVEQLGEYRRSSLGELLQAQEASQAAIDSISDPVIVFAAEGYALSTNRAADRLLGLGNPATASHPLAQLEPDLRAAVERVRAHVLAGKGAYAPRGFEEAERVATPDGELFLLPRATPVYSEEGAIVGATVILQDVTRLHGFDELKNDLVATAAHELRTPLTSLRMAIHLCVEEAAGPLNPKQTDLLQAAREDCERLQATIDELLDLARLQGGRVQLERRPVEVATLVEAATEPLLAGARERQVRIETELVPFLPSLDVDPERAQLVLTNLVGNAIRHSPSGTAVRIVAARADGAVRFEVHDEGEGVGEEHRAHVFEKFYQVPGTASGGSGLGLSIAHDIVLAHGGEIGVAPNRKADGGEGSTFWFTLPAVAP